MTTLIPDLVTIERPDTSVYRPSGLPDVKNGFVPKPSLLFVFKVKDKVRRDGIFERQVTRLAIAIRVPDARHHIDTFAFGEIRPVPQGAGPSGERLAALNTSVTVKLVSNLLGQISK